MAPNQPLTTFCHLFITFANSLDPDQPAQNMVRPDLSSNTEIIFCERAINRESSISLSAKEGPRADTGLSSLTQGMIPNMSFNLVMNLTQKALIQSIILV